jgi:hypothetical protein
MSAFVATVVAVGYTIYSGERAAENQRQQLELQRQSQANAMEQQKKADKMAEEATNKANSKRPDAQGIMAAAEQSAMAGDMSTMLTGSQGVKPEDMQLGRKTLLG